jgi:ATP-dependent RNA helicase DeaD
MTTDFNVLNLHPQLVQSVVEQGYVTPMPIQSAVIPLMLAGNDVIDQAQTGTGKTAAYALPILQNIVAGGKKPQALVLAPTRELALQVAEAFSAYGKYSQARVLAVYGGQSYSPQINQLRRGVDIIAGTPGRLIDLTEKNILDLSEIRVVVLDEADEMLSMGFVEDIESILTQTPADRQTALFSATMPVEIRRLAEKYLNNAQHVAIQSEQVSVETIQQRCYLVKESDKLAALTRLFEVEEITSTLIFVRTRTGTGELANELTLRGFPAEALSGDLSQDAREHTLGRFRKNQIKVLVATDVAARGLDIDDISHVFNYDLPEDPEVYIHRIGRTGRAGKRGVAISLFSPSEKRRMYQIERFARKKIERAKLPTEDEIRSNREEKLLNQTKMWLQRERYKREKELVIQLQMEGFDPLDIAAAALKVARAEEKQRPIAAVTELVEIVKTDHPREAKSRSGRNGSRRSFERTQEQGMVRLSLNMGKQHGIRPNDIVGAIAGDAHIPGYVIGKIFIQENHSLVDVPEEFISQVLSRKTNVRIRQQPVVLQRA